MSDTYLPAGDGAVVRAVADKLREVGRGAIPDYGADTALGNETNDNDAFAKAFNYQSGTRPYTAADGGAWGIGRTILPKARYHLTPISFGGLSQLGMDIGGDSPFATTLDFTLPSGAAFSFQPYANLRLHDFTLRNLNATPGASVGISLNGLDGGGSLHLERLVIEGFGTAIKIEGAVMPTKRLSIRSSSGEESASIRARTRTPSAGLSSIVPAASRIRISSWAAAEKCW